MTKVLFTTDVHGSLVCFRKFVAAADFYGADVIIMGGDCTGKMLVPMVGNDSQRTATYVDREWVLSTADEIADFERRVANAGYYPVKLAPDEMAELQADRAKVDQFFIDTMRSTLSDWLEYAEAEAARQERHLCDHSRERRRSRHRRGARSATTSSLPARTR